MMIIIMLIRIVIITMIIMIIIIVIIVIMTTMILTQDDSSNILHQHCYLCQRCVLVLALFLRLLWVLACSLDLLLEGLGAGAGAEVQDFGGSDSKPTISLERGQLLHLNNTG